MKTFRALLALALGAPGAALATPAIVQPVEATSKDVFLYEGAAGANWNVAFGNVLVSGEHSGGHECRALVQFDLAGLSLAPGETATLNLIRDFVLSSPDGTFRAPHNRNYNQLKLDFSVSFEKETGYGFTYP